MSGVQSFLTGNGDQRQTLVVVFLRGGADGLNLVAPLDDDGYHRARPRIAIGKKEAVALDGFYGLNPLLSSLERPYKDGALAIIHAAGSEDDTRSHFEAQDLMEHGGIAAGGWLVASCARKTRRASARFPPWRWGGRFRNVCAARRQPRCWNRWMIFRWATIGRGSCVR